MLSPEEKRKMLAKILADREAYMKRLRKGMITRPLPLQLGDARDR